MVTERTVDDNADLHLRWQGVSQLDQALVFILVVTVLEGGCVDGQPRQRRGATMAGQQGKHERGLAVAVELGQSMHTSMRMRRCRTRGTQ